MSVDILLATFQGEKYLKEQLDSLLHQTYPHFQILIRDDGSTDATLDIIKTYKDPRIKLLATGHLGIKGNFSELMRHSQADYLFFCDQDDVWLSHKIATMLPYLKGGPTLVHSDLGVVDEKLNSIAPSFWKWAWLQPMKTTTLNRLLMQNVVTGCSMAINRSLLEKSGPIPQDAVMHDWWLALVAACFGRIQPLKEPLMLYRQHDSNVLGARSSRQQGRSLTPFYAQAQAFLDRYQLSPHHQEILKAYLSLPSLPSFKRRLSLIRHGFYKQGLLRNLKLFL